MAGPFTAMLVRVLGETAGAGLEAYGRTREAPPPTKGAKTRRVKKRCEPCAAIKNVERTKDRVAQGKL